MQTLIDDAATEASEEAPAALVAARSTRRAQPSDVALGARIRTVRVAAGMSQVALGAAVGISFQQVQKYELAKDRISAAMLFGFAAALKVPVGALYDGVPQHGAAKLPRSSRGDALSVKIALLFQQIDDPGIRKQLVALAAALADGRAGAAPGIADGADS